MNLLYKYITWVCCDYICEREKKRKDNGRERKREGRGVLAVRLTVKQYNSSPTHHILNYHNIPSISYGPRYLVKHIA